MSGYIGTQPVPQATQTRDAFTATNNQTSFPTSGYTPEFLDVFLNGVKLAASDYTATNGSDVVLAAGATTGDILEVVSYGTFEVLNPTFDGNVTFTGNASFGDNDKAIFGDGSELQIYSDGTHGIIKESGSGDLLIYGNNLRLGNADGSELYILGNNNAEVQLRYDNSTKLATTATGIDVTGDTDTSGLFRFGVNNSEIANNYVRFKSGGAAYFDHSTVGQSFNFRVSNSSSLDTNAMTIDSSGNVLVGKTTSDFNTQGNNLKAGGHFVFDGNSALYLNRLSSDGSILALYKDGSLTGSIGTNGSYPYIGSHGTSGKGIKITDALLPATNSGAFNDANVNLGASNVRWKDLYLSGGVYLGGTGSANKLEDYEEGTWTATINGQTTAPSSPQTTTAYYTKVGNMVTVFMRFNNKNTTGASGNLMITGLPFSCSAVGAENQAAVPMVHNLPVTEKYMTGYIANGSTTIFFINNKDNTSWTTAQISSNTGVYLNMNITYQTNS